MKTVKQRLAKKIASVKKANDKAKANGPSGKKGLMQDQVDKMQSRHDSMK